MTTTTRRPVAAFPARDQTAAERPHLAYRVLIGLAVLGLVLQGLWAGIFLEHDGERDAAGSWIDLHARDGEVTILLLALSTVAALVWNRRRRDLWIGSGIATVLLVVEAYLGGLIRDQSKDTLTAVHVPLALVATVLVVWLAARALDWRRP